ncbi:hypothetical protein Clacol_006862 [Clathrus columnatus]|uniref:DNA-(apurinic or apyrimidinic site) lyase n=1 Tax=Clathrus columnatus TaxID=1419009 RepID=A0AAV5AHI7_9AGAM|nr:hypothetical protein Clacol_006862 [Clathrus columnatus]
MVSIPPPGFRALPLSIAQLSLSAVLKCGQSFRWMTIPVTNPSFSELNPAFEYRLTLKDRVVCLRQTSDTLFYRGLYPTLGHGALSDSRKDDETLVWLRDYFQLDVDLLSLYDEWSIRDPVFKKIKDRFSGIRILRQDPWECLMSFVCSQNNHISRITNMVQALCTNFSSPILSLPAPDGTLSHYYPFPSPSALAGPGTATKLRSLGFGYRAEYIQRTAQMLVEMQKEGPSSNLDPEIYLRSLRTKPTDEARGALLKFVGVGRKVADCVLLMSLDKHDVVPVDTHVYQIAVKDYGLRGNKSGSKVTMTPKLYDEIQKRLSPVWGRYAGWAHSVLFTSDLKAFSEYGLETPKSESVSKKTGLPTPEPSLSPEKPRQRKPKAQSRSQTIKPEPDVIGEILTLPITPVKRKRGVIDTDVSPVPLVDSGSLAERVKQRRRTQLQPKVEPVSA